MSRLIVIRHYRFIVYAFGNLMVRPKARRLLWLRQIISEDLAGSTLTPQQTRTVFPPGQIYFYLHIGHARSYLPELDRPGLPRPGCNLRFGDTNR